MAATKQLLTALQLCSTSYRGLFPLTEEAIDSWSILTTDMDQNMLLAAFIGWVREQNQPPTIADIRHRVQTVEGQGAEGAWQLVLRVVMGGRYREPGFKVSPIIESSVKAAGGWKVIGQTEEVDLRHRKREFIAAYFAYGEAEQVKAVLGIASGDAAKKLRGGQ